MNKISILKRRLTLAWISCYKNGDSCNMQCDKCDISKNIDNIVLEIKNLGNEYLHIPNMINQGVDYMFNIPKESK